MTHQQSRRRMKTLPEDLQTISASLTTYTHSQAGTHLNEIPIVGETDSFHTMVAGSEACVSTAGLTYNDLRDRHSSTGPYAR